VTKEEARPPNDLTWRRVWLGAKDMALMNAPGEPAIVSFDMRGKGIRFSWTMMEDIDIIGPMALRLPIELQGVDDMNPFAGIRKFRRGQEILFEGSFGFARDIVSKGWQRAAHRELDAALATQAQPVHTPFPHRTFESRRDRSIGDRIAPARDQVPERRCSLSRSARCLVLRKRPSERPIPGLL